MAERRRARARRAGLVAGGVAAAAGLAYAAGRAFVARDRRRPDPEAREPYGEPFGKPVGPVVASDGTRLHVVEAGDGPLTLVFVHGFSLDHTTWHFQLRELSEDFRVVAFDHRGHGRSPVEAGAELSLAVLARDLDAVLRAVADERPVVVVGHSMGGMTILEHLRSFPDAPGSRLHGLVLVDTTAADVIGGMLPGVARRVGATIQGFQEAAMRALAGRPERFDGLRRGWRATPLGYLSVRVMGFGPRPSPAQVNFVDGLLSHTPGHVWMPLVEAMMAMDVLDVCGRIGVPTLVVAGSHDRLTPPGAARRIALAVRGAELAVIPDAGHMAPLEKPQAFNARLRAFLARVGARAPA